ncbi:helix-turn-helix domain-containing protein [Klebsiella indica]|nr:helix-turn-helix domain-containing protein [Klebsiella indica]
MSELAEEFSLQFLNVISQSFPPENRLQIILILRGEVVLNLAGEAGQVLRDNEAQIINFNTAFRVSGERDNIIIIISISPFLLFNRPGGLNPFNFSIDAHRFPEQAAMIGERVKNVAMLWLKQNSETWRLEAIRFLLDIVCLLLRYFKSSAPVHQANRLSLRISKAVSWMREHYQEDISLNLIASLLHVTSAHLSRQFSAEVGQNFRTFLTELRFEHAVKEIALTSRPISQIVSDNKFCSMHRFSLLFRERYGLTPGDWRKGVKAGAIVPAIDKSISMEMPKTREVSSVMLFSLLSQASSATNQLDHKEELNLKIERITPSFSGEIDKVKSRCYVIAVGSFTELLKEHVQQQLICLSSGLKNIQVEINDPLEEIFPLQNIHTGELNPTWSPWSNLDIALNFLKKMNLQLVVRLSAISERIARIEEFILHSLLLLGEEYLRGWSFLLEYSMCNGEISCEMTQKQLQLIRDLLPNASVGLAWFNDKNGVSLPPVELLKEIEFIAFSIISNEHDDQLNSPEFKPLENNKVAQVQIDEIIQLLKKHNLHCQLYLQSWSTLTGNTLMINGPFFRGALLMDMLLSLPEEVVMVGLWLNSEQQKEVCVSNTINNNSLSLFFSGMTKRPVFHIVSIKERLNGVICDTGSDWIATRTGNTRQLLLLNAVTINPLLSVQQHFLNDYSKRFTIQLDLGEPGIWRIKKWVFDQKNGALYHQYGLHPTRYDRDEETMRYITLRSEPTLSVHDEFIVRNWSTEITMDINAVCLLELIKIAR